jgi:hypothetical protein
MSVLKGLAKSRASGAINTRGSSYIANRKLFSGKNLEQLTDDVAQFSHKNKPLEENIGIFGKFFPKEKRMSWYEKILSWGKDILNPKMSEIPQLSIIRTS